MDLWIRSQNKETLLKINYLWADENTIRCEDELLAEYKTKGRAIEVLDEIQTKIMDSYQLYEINRVNLEDCTGTHKFKIPCQLPVIYEMPKE